MEITALYKGGKTKLVTTRRPFIDVVWSQAEMFASKAGQEEKWATVTWHGELDVPLIEGCPATVVCERGDLIPAGDHVIVTGEVLEVDYDSGAAEPLVYHGGLFRTLDPARDES